ncbi:MAG: heavy metal translocating P-type ATPase [Chloroflexota bacterium]|nr:heavy metal translocating P-type ATPase [Chloroflexota bacterium]
MSQSQTVPFGFRSTGKTGRSGDNDEIERCADVLRQAVETRPGLVSAELNVRKGELTLEYDPTVLPAPEADQLISQVSAAMDHRYDICASMLAGFDCDTCADSRDPGLWDESAGNSAAIVTLRPGLVTVATGGMPAVRAQVKRKIHPSDLAGDEGLRWPWQRWDLSQWEILLTTITGICIAAAWIGSAFGLPQTWQTALYVVAYLTGGYFGVREGLSELRRGVINVDLLMVLAAIGAAIIGDWREGAILLFLFSLSNTLQSYAMGRSRRAIEALMTLRPEEALVRRDRTEVWVRVEDLKLGDVVLVRPGERLPVDGTILRGTSSIDQSTITGESVPVDVESGGQVFAGTLNKQGALEVEVNHLAGESTLARIIELVENAQEEKAPTQRFLDDFEQKYAIGVIVATMLAIIVPFVFLDQPFDDVFYRAMTFLVVASPCALVISVPAAILSGIANAARKGILFKGGAYLESLATVKAMAFDKTGTLTEGKPVVTDLIPLGCCAEQDDLLALAASVESRSEHPLALAIVAEARHRGLEFEPCDELEAVTGRGARAVAGDGRVFLIGNLDLFQDRIAFSNELCGAMGELESQGKTAMLLGEEQEEGVVLHGLIAVADQIRPEARQALDDLRGQGIEHIIMLTGDNERVARSVAQQTGVDEYRAGLLPGEKVDAVQELQGEFGSVAMVGDGVNDAPALAAASLGIAMGAAGTDVALETADVVLMSDELENISYVVDLSHRARRIILQNIAFALGVMVILVVANFVVGVPLPLGVVAHEGSTLIVVANGLRLLR